MFDGIFAPDKLLLIAVVGLLLFGPKRLPQIGRSVGRWLGEFRHAAGGLGEELRTGLNEPLAASATEPAKVVETPAEPGPRPPAAAE
jgi:sec-independent protein translocase protein TatA